MTTLDDAWNWYRSADEAGSLLVALAGYWNEFPWETMPAPANRLRHTQDTDLARIGESVDRSLGDVAVFVLFSVFEANVRDVVKAQVRPEMETLKHPALVRAGEDLLDGIEEGSFARVLTLLKTAATNDLVEQVNQVRRYRNWVAHGRRAERKPAVSIDPKTAYDRLRVFLELVQRSGSTGS